MVRFVPLFSPEIRGRARWATGALLGLVALHTAAQTVGGGIRIPELNAEGRRTSLLTGERARMLPGKPVWIEGLTIEFYEEDGETVRMRLRSPGCEYDDRRGRARSSEEVHITGAGFDIQGRGYTYDGRAQTMEILSQVRVRIENLTARAKATSATTDPSDEVSTP